MRRSSIDNTERKPKRPLHSERKLLCFSHGQKRPCGSGITTVSTSRNKGRHGHSSATHSSHHGFKTGGEAPAASFLSLQTFTQTHVCVCELHRGNRSLCGAHFLVGGALAGSFQSGSVASDMYKLPEPAEVNTNGGSDENKKTQIHGLPYKTFKLTQRSHTGWDYLKKIKIKNDAFKSSF
ncbi:hypothetical protein FQA47_005428 [Oryzias melastigma]|uniref:Uncharacterized protein n=1 Tax=Oryzias melastigma TaxID=30732 RepID=A0A834BQP0_ORYME|nr:hypothetical protein FQA47_005428 [Oryzias melastigma]